MISTESMLQCHIKTQGVYSTTSWPTEAVLTPVGKINSRFDLQSINLFPLITSVPL